MVRKFYFALLAVGVLPLLVVGCTDCAGLTGEDSVNTTSLCGNRAGTEAARSATEDTGEFQKPRSFHEDYPDIFAGLAGVELREGDELVVGEYFVSSPEMAPDSAYDNGYLYHGESAIFRFGSVLHGENVREGTYRIQVLVNYEPVPFGMVEAESDGTFATDEEMLEWEERSQVRNYERREGEIFGMSIVVDPEHFEVGQANELRLLVIQDVDYPEQLAYTEAQPAVSMVGMLVHHGGSSPVALDCVSDPVRYIPSEEYQRRYHLRMSSFTELVHASVDANEEGWTDVREPDLRYVLDIDSSTAAIRSSIVNRVGSEPMTRYAVLYNYTTGEFTPLGLVENVPPLQVWDDWESFDDPAVKTYTDVEVEPGETNAFMTLYFDGWFHHDEAASGGFDSTFEASNLVCFEYNP